MQGVVVQTWTKFSPMGSLQYTLNKPSLQSALHVPVEHCVECSNLVDTHWRKLEELRDVVHHTDACPALVLPLT